MSPAPLSAKTSGLRAGLFRLVPALSLLAGLFAAPVAAQAQSCEKPAIAGEFCTVGKSRTGIRRVVVDIPCSAIGAGRRARGEMEVWGECARGECSWGRVRARLRDGRQSDGKFTRAVGRYDDKDGDRRRVVVRENRKGRLIVRINYRKGTDKAAGNRGNRDRLERCEG